MFPSWSDLGGEPADEDKSALEAQQARWSKFRRYYTGDIFKERVPLEGSQATSDDPLLYPVGLNLVKMMVLAQAEALFGEWSDQIMRFEVAPSVDPNAATESAIEIANIIGRENNFETLFYRLATDREAYGGSFLKISPDRSKRKGRISWSKIPLWNCIPVWDPDDPNRLLKLTILTEITAEQAELKYKIKTDKDTVIKKEVWEIDRHDLFVDDKRISAYSGVNPWKLIPAVFIPRLRTDNWWGDALTPDIIPVQDELNMRIADMGEALNYNAHPTRYGVNLPNAFNEDNFQLGPNAMWDLGRSIGNSPEPEVGILEVKNPIPQRALDYVNFIYDWSRTSSFAPPIAFGEDSGGGQRSGRTLEIRMWPLIRATMRSRAYFAQGITRALQITGTILSQKEYPETGKMGPGRLMQGDIIPSFFELLPRDEAAIIDEIVKSMETPVPVISLETALKKLRRPPGELDRIRDMLEDALWGKYFQAGPQAFGDGEEEEDELSDAEKIDRMAEGGEGGTDS